MAVPDFFSAILLYILIPGILATAGKETRTKNCIVDIGYNVSLVVDQARHLSSHSWEYGTAAEALLELYDPNLSIFGPEPFPGGQVPDVDWTKVNALSYVKPFILTNNETLIDGDGAVGDPASLGVSAVMIGQTDKTYFDAASREQNYVVNVAPRAWNDAISQRYNTPELWADFVYMAPPFLAYYAVATANTSLLRLTIQQCGLYRQILQANMTTTTQKNMQGIWEHIIGPNDYQPGLWSTGNGWAAAGMTRVLATTLKWEISASWTPEQQLLTQWIKEIIDGIMEGSATSIEPSSGLLRNYLNATSWFGETSGTALISSVVYRMAILVPDIFGQGSIYITWAEKLRKSIVAHVDANGILSPAINPLSWDDDTPYTTGSPEGQSFGVLLAAAYRDWVCTL